VESKGRDGRARLVVYDAPQEEENQMATKTTTPKPMTKSQLVEAVLKAHGQGIAKRDVKMIIEAVAAVGHRELKKTSTFVIPGLAKLLVIKKPATKAREGINPFTGEPTVFKAKPARKVVKARPLKAARDAVT
jgi:nucleoid DNA-binding protein